MNLDLLPLAALTLAVLSLVLFFLNVYPTSKLVRGACWILVLVGALSYTYSLNNLYGKPKHSTWDSLPADTLILSHHPAPPFFYLWLLFPGDHSHSPPRYYAVPYDEELHRALAGVPEGSQTYKQDNQGTTNSDGEFLYHVNPYEKD